MGLLTLCDAEGVDSSSANLPVRPPAAPRSSDIAGTIGWIIQNLHPGFARVVRTISDHRARETRATSWATTRGGYGGPGSEAQDKSIAYDLTDYSEPLGGFAHRPAPDVANRDW